MKIGDFINGIEQSVSSVFTAAQRWVRPVFRDPLTFDLNGNGLETVPISPSNPILFDHTGSGIKAGTGWIAPSDGFLVLDRNGNGMIDNGTELFGDSTPLASGGKAEDGFAALAAQDTNADGAVNALDANFASLRVWQDSNQDGISFDDANGNGILDAGETSELRTLSELDIASIKVGKIEHSSILTNGNEIADLGSFTRTDGSAGGMGVTSGLADVNLAADTFHRTFIDTVPLAAGVAALPDMRGSGVVRDLREAASLPAPEGAALATMLAAYAASATSTGQHAQIDALIAGWGATSGFEDMQTKAAAHAYTLATNLDAVHLARLVVLEQFNGRGFYLMPWETATGQQGMTGLSVSGTQITITMSQTQIDLLDQAYSALKESVYDALVVQTRLKPYLDGIGLALTNGNFVLDTGGVLAAFQSRMSLDAETALTDLVDFNRIAKTALKGTNWSTQGPDLFDSTLRSLPMTPTVMLALSEQGFQVEGQAGFIPNGTAKDDIVIGSDQDSISQGNELKTLDELGIASITYTLTDNVENLTLTGDASIDGTGNSGNNTLLVLEDNDTLDGGSGALVDAANEVVWRIAA